MFFIRFKDVWNFEHNKKKITSKPTRFDTVQTDNIYPFFHYLLHQSLINLTVINI